MMIVVNKVLRRTGEVSRLDPLSIDHIKSGGRNWCWAACGAMLRSWKANDVEPCDAASWILTKTCCPKNKECEVPLAKSKIPRLIEYTKLMSARPLADQTFESVVRERKAERAILVWTDVAGPLDHLVIIRGVIETTGFVYVLDPARAGIPAIPFKKLARYVGRWRYAWSVQ